MKLLTTGEIARQVNVDRDSVSYALRKLAIEPSGTAGQTRVFPDSVLAKLKDFLNSNERQQGRKNDC